MPQKTGASAEALLEKITGYLGGRISRAEAASQMQIKANGMPGLEARKEWTRYSAEEKTQAVIEYLKGNGLLDTICEKYGIRSNATLRDWIKAYNRHTRTRCLTGGSRITEGRETTKEERLALVQECIANGLL